MCKISVIMSCYNESYNEVKTAIQSILNQTFVDFEFIIIIDNPNNLDIINIIKEVKDKRIIVIKNKENIGLAASLNEGINISKGKYIARMDADDISLPDRLKIEFDYLEKNKNIDIISSNILFIDEKGNLLDRKSQLPQNDMIIKKMMINDSVIVHPAVMFRKDKIVELGNYRLFPTSQDYDLWLRAISANLCFYNIETPLLKYRVRDKSISNSNPRKQYLIRRYIKKMYKERMKKGKDSFSVNDLSKYLKRKKADNHKKNVNFKKSIIFYDKAKKALKSKKILTFFYFLMLSTMHSKTFLCYFGDSIVKFFNTIKLRRK